MHSITLGYKQIVHLINGTAAEVVNNIRDRMLAQSFADGKHRDIEDKRSPIHPRLAWIYTEDGTLTTLNAMIRKLVRSSQVAGVSG